MIVMPLVGLTGLIKTHAPTLNVSRETFSMNEVP
jgi:hypothetical protein